eukprot:gnl/MRDRNA2_/MRDRNA2_261637_c0_seq1.p1 gnl/MRDRNA2_/MRDRNA2_261637_c0~~gnl/MRDRNA2_/MRDRNA2_261637_c0_seq1.p1  ORF type:complete len:336 (+),score=54.80 gnl/MRDRNA2_/MRDRNA2_261637_c0_seq1:148-1008(+)
MARSPFQTEMPSFSFTTGAPATWSAFSSPSSAPTAWPAFSSSTIALTLPVPVASVPQVSQTNSLTVNREAFNLACADVGLDREKTEALWIRLGHGSLQRIVTGATAPRADATNVNQWHWSDVDITDWAKERLEELLMPLTAGVDPKSWGVAVKKVETKGEGSVCNRKGKRIVAFEFDVTCEWKGQIDGETVEGKLLLPYVSEDVEGDEKYQVKLEAKDSEKPNQQKALEYLREQLPKVQQALQIFASEIKNPQMNPAVHLQPKNKQKAFDAKHAQLQNSMSKCLNR